VPEMSKEMKKAEYVSSITRRELLKTSALVGGSAALASQVPWVVS